LFTQKIEVLHPVLIFKKDVHRPDPTLYNMMRVSRSYDSLHPCHTIKLPKSSRTCNKKLYCVPVIM
jgi:hypothetical protein